MIPAAATPRRRYWFRAKRYGWGWGLPCAWEGWVVLAVYAMLFVVLASDLGSAGDLPRFLAGAVLLSAVLVVICCLKGEPARWRWGKQDSDA